MYEQDTVTRTVAVRTASNRPRLRAGYTIISRAKEGAWPGHDPSEREVPEPRGYRTEADARAPSAGPTGGPGGEAARINDRDCATPPAVLSELRTIMLSASPDTVWADGYFDAEASRATVIVSESEYRRFQSHVRSSREVVICIQTRGHQVVGFEYR